MADTFAARLRSLMDQAGLSISDLARASGVPRQTLHRYLKGQRKPTLEHAQKVAAALGKRTDVFEGVSWGE